MECEGRREKGNRAYQMTLWHLHDSMEFSDDMVYDLTGQAGKHFATFDRLLVGLDTLYLLHRPFVQTIESNLNQRR
jgi:hypothetical protein